MLYSIFPNFVLNKAQHLYSYCTHRSTGWVEEAVFPSATSSRSREESASPCQVDPVYYEPYDEDDPPDDGGLIIIIIYFV